MKCLFRSFWTKRLHISNIKSQETFDIDYMEYLRGSERTEDEESAIDFLDFVDERSLNGQTYGL